MRRSVVAAFVILISTQMLAAETKQYIVLMRGPVRDVSDIRARVRDFDVPVQGRDVVTFRNIDGFAAALTPSEVSALQRSPQVVSVEEVIERKAFAERRNHLGQTIPYGIDTVRARDAWVGSVPRGGNINVAVLDTGVDHSHPELKAIYAGGTDLINKDADPMDDNNHGTHVSGTIAAADNTVGVVGVAPGVRLWGVKVLNDEGEGSNLTVVQGIDWLISKKAELGGNWVANLSLGAPKSSAAEKTAVEKAIAAGIILVAATGNASEPDAPAPVSYPAAYPDVIAVGAIDDKLALATFSNQGPEVDVVAPGVAVLSSVRAGTGSQGFVLTGNGDEHFPGYTLTGAPLGTVTASYVYCGLGGKKEDFPASVAGKIALIRRGDFTFAVKARNAKEAGAIGVVIFNKDTTTSFSNVTLTNTDDVWSANYQFPPTVGIDLPDGEALIRKGNGTITIRLEASDYSYFQGTSMSCPHVAGAVALIWGLRPNATAVEVRDALIKTTRDLGAAGPDSEFGHGLINTLEAAKTLAPDVFSTPSIPTSSKPTTGRVPGRRR